MKEHMDKVPQGLEFLLDSVREAGVEPEYEIIRGGTDGARLAEMRYPTPNVFTGGHNFSQQEGMGSAFNYGKILHHRDKSD